MKRVRKLSSTSLSALVFSLLSPVSYGLGLADIELHSKLNEPLEAVIALQDTNGMELHDIIAKLAAPKAYSDAGVPQMSWLAQLQFEVFKESNSNKFGIKVTTPLPIKDPFVDLLVEVVWPNGKLVKQYTLLLDPPKIAENSTLLQAKEKSIEKEIAIGGSYQPQQGETLWSIAKRLVHDTPFTVHQAIAAIHQKNPHAFKQDDINLMLTDASLTLPNMTEMGGSVAERGIQVAKVKSKRTEHRDPQHGLAPIPKFVAEEDHKPLKIVDVAVAEDALDTLKRSHEEMTRQYHTLKQESESMVALLATKEKEITRLKEEVKQSELLLNRDLMIGQPFAVAIASSAVKKYEPERVQQVGANAQDNPPNKVWTDSAQLTIAEKPLNNAGNKKDLLFLSLIGAPCLVVLGWVIQRGYYLLRRKISMTNQSNIADPMMTRQMNYGVHFDLEKSLTAIALEEKNKQFAHDRTNQGEANVTSKADIQEDIDSQVSLAQAYVEIGDFAAAKELLRQIIPKTPEQTNLVKTILDRLPTGVKRG